MKQKKKGISLIVLIITIIVIVILATTIIVNLTQTNLIENTNESVVKQDFKTMQEELSLYMADKYVNSNGKFESDKLNADVNSVTYTGKETVNETNIYEILTSLKSNNKYKVAIINGKIVVDESMDEQIKQWAKEAINSISTVIPSTPTEPEISSTRYLLVEVNGYLENEDCAAINELQIYDKELNKCEYTVLNELEYDSATGGKSFHWEDMRYWNYTNLNDNAYTYTNNTTGNQNCTVFLLGNNGNANSWARFVIDLGRNIDIGQILVSIGGYDELSPAKSRTPKEISFYKINNFVDGILTGSTYNNNIIHQNNKGLTLIGKKEFSNILSVSTWIEFLDYNCNKECINARYLLVEVNGYLENEDCAVINEITVYNKYNQIHNFTVLNELEYDSATGGKSSYWEDMRYWNYTNLNDNAYTYTNNTTGNQNCTVFLIGNNGNANSWARFVIDLGENTDITQISFNIGGYDEFSPATSRTPKEVRFYKVDSFIDGKTENSTYNNNIIQQNNDGLSLLVNKQFEDICTTATEFKIKF